VESKQHRVVMEVLHRLENAGVLEQLVLVGSWCLYFYRDYFKEGAFYSVLRTRDIDFLVPTPVRVPIRVNVIELLEDLGFIPEIKAGGYIQLMHPEVMLEFLVAERGRGSDKPYPLPHLGVNAQPLRFMDIANDAAISLNFEDISLHVPHPAAFALHKLIIVPRRKSEAKALRDINSAVEILTLLLDSGDVEMIIDQLHRFPRTWKKTIYRVLEESNHQNLVASLRPLDQ
jgi:hypothetical protein